MKRKSVVVGTIFSVVLLFVVGCESTNQQEYIRLKPIMIKEGRSYFRYVSPLTKVGGHHDPYSEKEEAAQIAFMKADFKGSGFDEDTYIIASRHLVIYEDPNANPRYDAYYDILPKLRKSLEEIVGLPKPKRKPVLRKSQDHDHEH